jgi:hypothetical protein
MNHMNAIQRAALIQKLVAEQIAEVGCEPDCETCSTGVALGEPGSKVNIESIYKAYGLGYYAGYVDTLPIVAKMAVHLVEYQHLGLLEDRREYTAEDLQKSLDLSDREAAVLYCMVQAQFQ